MLDRAGEYVGDGLDPAMRMPRKPGKIIFRVVVAKIIQQKEGIEFLRLAETEGALQFYASAFERGFRLYDLFNWSERHKFLLLNRAPSFDVFLRRTIQAFTN